MNIIWKPNPLKTVIELDEGDRFKLLEALSHTYLKESLINALSSLLNLKPSVSAIKEAVITSIGFGSATRFQVLLEQMAFYEEALQKEHEGDCVCLPFTCAKCLAEGWLGVNTLKGLSQESASHLRRQFKATDPESLPAVIALLENYEPIRGGTWLAFPEHHFDAHRPPWRAEAAEALQWLRKYQTEHS